MMPVSRKVSVAATLGAMLAAGVFGYAVLSPGVGGAQQTTTTPSSGAPSSATPGAKSFQGNEDPTHEKAESAQREADEKAGKAHFGGRGDGAFHPNTDPAHEKTESTEREKQEQAGQHPTGP